MADAVCKAPICRKPIVWVTLIVSGKRHPVDPYPDPNGNIKIIRSGGDGRPNAVVLSNAQRETHDGPLYVSHFATCPAAQSFRR